MHRCRTESDRSRKLITRHRALYSGKAKGIQQHRLGVFLDTRHSRVLVGFLLVQCRALVGILLRCWQTEELFIAYWHPAGELAEHATTRTSCRHDENISSYSPAVMYPLPTLDRRIYAHESSAGGLVFARCPRPRMNQIVCLNPSLNPRDSCVLLATVGVCMVRCAGMPT
eukprot:COSAG02_NODE_23_length_52893_cov_58.101868_39_plen_170_part_00